MKKIFILLGVILSFIGCNPAGVVSEGNIKKALDIAYAETKDYEYKGYGGNDSFMFIKMYLKDQRYHNHIECMVLDESDVEGKKSVRSCIFPNGNPDGETTFGSNNILVKAIHGKENRDIVALVFFTDAEKTEKGVRFSTLMPMGIAVNLQTRKIGEL